MLQHHQDIRIGTLASAGKNTGEYLRQILPHGFESISLTFWQTLGDTDLKQLAQDVKGAIGDRDVVISSLGIFGNPLESGDKDQETRQAWAALIDHAHLFALIDPMPQLRQWASRIFHVHGKDATILHDVVRQHGVYGKEPFAFHRTPGFGDSNWSAIISDLRRAGFQGSIDIEGWHDPVYRDELEMTGQVHALNYLKQCRGGPFVPNPTV
jgi:sugar phosphate isomerase/epimerase